MAKKFWRRESKPVTKEDLDLLVAKDLAKTSQVVCFCRNCGAHNQETAHQASSLIDVCTGREIFGISYLTHYFVLGVCDKCRKDEPLTLAIRKKKF